MIFLDSGYFKALNDDKDLNHEESLKIESYLECSNEITVINTTVLVETLNRVSGSYDVVKQVHNELYTKNQVIQTEACCFLPSKAQFYKHEPHSA